MQDDEPLTYKEPQESQDERHGLRESWRNERALILRNLLACVPQADQGEAMAGILLLEQVATLYARDLQASWHRSIQTAYRAGVRTNLVTIDETPPAPDAAVH
jgi:hypothetical protein